MTQEIKDALLEYAMEDIALTKHDGCIAVTGTKNGVITLNYLPGSKFQAFDNLGKPLTEAIEEVAMIEWLQSIYTVDHTDYESWVGQEVYDTVKDQQCALLHVVLGDFMGYVFHPIAGAYKTDLSNLKLIQHD